MVRVRTQNTWKRVETRGNAWGEWYKRRPRQSHAGWDDNEQRALIRVTRRESQRLYRLPHPHLVRDQAPPVSRVLHVSLVHSPINSGTHVVIYTVIYWWREAPSKQTMI